MTANEKIKKLLSDIGKALGHYSEIGGPDCPYHKTDDDKIRECLTKINEAIETAAINMNEEKELEAYHLGYADGLAACSVEITKLGKALFSQTAKLNNIEECYENERQLKIFYAAQVRRLEKIVSSYKTISMN